jgi:hypothetical protein
MPANKKKDTQTNRFNWVCFIFNFQCRDLSKCNFVIWNINLYIDMCFHIKVSVKGTILFKSFSRQLLKDGIPGHNLQNIAPRNFQSKTKK